MTLAKLTAPDGNDIWINPDMVCSVSRNIDGSGNSKTAIHHASGVQYVRQIPEQAVQILLGEKP
jgi:hypothetical protein